MWRISVAPMVDRHKYHSPHRLARILRVPPGQNSSASQAGRRAGTRKRDANSIGV